MKRPTAVLASLARRARTRWPATAARLTGELPLSSGAALFSPGVPGRDQAIPRVVHQSWSAPLFGRRHLAAITAFRARNPDYAFRFHDDDDLDRFMAARPDGEQLYRIFSSARFGPLKTDIWRYAILHDEGGVYCDIGKGLVRPLDTLFPATAHGVISYEANAFAPIGPLPPDLLYPERRVINWAFMFAPRHPLMVRVLNGIMAKYDIYRGRVMDDPKAAILCFTGPVHLTECLHAHALERGLSNITQAGIDFDDAAILELPGSYVRYLDRPAYGLARGAVIVD